MVSETSVLVYNSSNCNRAEYINAKIEYMRQLHDILRIADVNGAIWYTIDPGNEWNCSDIPAGALSEFWKLFLVE